MGTHRKLVRKGCTWALALVALALITAAPALGQLRKRPAAPILPDVNSACGGAITPSFITPDTVTTGGYLVGDAVTISVSIARTGSTTSTDTATFSEFDLDLACSSFDAPCTTLDATGPDAWDNSVSTTCVDAASSLVTWTTAEAVFPAAGDTAQPVVLTSNNPVVLKGNGSCSITFTVKVLKTTSDGGPNQIAHEAQTPTNGLTCSSGGHATVAGSYAFNVNSCGIVLDKQISCDFAFWNDPARGNNPANATWHDVGVNSTDHCQGFTGDVIAIRYVVHNSGTLPESGCSITSDVGPVGGTTMAIDDLTDAVFSDPIAAGSTSTSTVVTEDATGTMNSLLCNPGHTAKEPNLATAQCTCSNTTPTVKPTAQDQASFSCVTCNAQIDKEVSCNGGAFTDVTCTDPPTNSMPTNCDPTTAGIGNGLNVQSCMALNGFCSDGSVPTNSGTCTGAGSMSATNPIPCVCGNGATYVAGQNITVKYVISNPGLEAGATMGVAALDELDNCTLMETNGAIVFAGTTLGNDMTREIPDTNPNCTGTPPSETCTFAAGTTQSLTFTNECTNVLGFGESTNDTATLSCTCKPLIGNTGTMTVTRQDTAKFSCLQPQLQVVKTCVQDLTTAGKDNIKLTATNGSTTVNLINCTAADNLNLTGSCASFPTALSPPLAASPTTNCPGAGTTGCSIAESASQEWDGAITGLTADACNMGSVTCTIAGTQTQIMASSTVICPFTPAGCETRTPGFWKTHPNITEAVMDFLANDTAPIPVDTNFSSDPDVGLSSCGLNLTTVLANTDCSVIDDLCIIGQNAKINNVNPTQANLIFQCAAAELNLAVTRLDGFSCPAMIPGSQLTFDHCCGVGGVCATGNTTDLAACQAAVGNFNGLFDNVTLSPNSPLNVPGAEPDLCQENQGSGNINDPTALGTAVADCGGSRKYILKK